MVNNFRKPRDANKYNLTGKYRRIDYRFFNLCARCNSFFTKDFIRCKWCGILLRTYPKQNRRNHYEQRKNGKKYHG